MTRRPALTMARITVEDCLKKVENRFVLVHVAAKRAKELFKGADPLVRCKNKAVVTALREVAAGSVSYDPDSLPPLVKKLDRK